MRKALCGAAVVCVAIVGFASAAGAASQHQTSVQAKVATRAGAAAYLRSLGLDPARVVIQRGARNYAGPTCPGAGWNCTTSYRVFQISTSSAGGNEFSCTPTGSATQSPPDGCTIVQSSTTANNVAACKLARSATTSDPVTQNCSVTQTNGSGANRVELKEEFTTTGFATTSVTQKAMVSQTNGSGANVVALTQRSTESKSDASAASVSWAQSASQDIDIDQNADTGTNSIDISQAVSQTQTAGNATTGSQSQTADQQAEADQFSHGVSTLKIKQSESQSQTAKITGSVVQTQVGPQDCCSFQADNPADTATVKQEAKQVQVPTGGSQSEQQTVTYSSAGNVSGSQTTTQGGQTSTNSFSGSTVSEQQGCTGGNCTVEEPPPPPEPTPANWQSFFWSGTTVTGSPFAVSGGGPVVMSVTDGFCRGDRFTLSEGATTLGTTSDVPIDPTCSNPINNGPAAWADPTYSQGTFALTAGSHMIGIVVSTSPFGSGQAFYSVDPMTSAHCVAGRWATFTYPAFTSEAACLAFVGA